MIIEETLRNKFETLDTPEPCDIRLCDFDGTRYRIFADEEQPTLLYLSVWLRCYSDVYAAGAADMIASVYAGLFTSEAEENFDLTLCIDLANLPGEMEEIVAKCANLKRNLMAAPFERAFTCLAEKSSCDPCVLNFRERESIFIIPQGSDRVVVVFSVHFDSKDEQAVARVFLQEFAEARSRVKNGPPATYRNEPPRELEGLDVPDCSLGFLSIGKSGVFACRKMVGKQLVRMLTSTYHVFALPPSPGAFDTVIFQSHVKNLESLTNAASQLQSFRTYLHYHIKASKSYLHTRMRSRVSSLLDVLKQAKPAAEKQKRTAGGKTFRRK